ncbi:helix-turn-helix domain-containing protein [Paenibacillus oleatilyticus]|uniref:Helix-turn-helix domain-containing protein n=1 Tax=Paenibacillus oleatilyticus TaxID=2594886 RepID=A0ABV4UZZ6_9BACL
MESDPRIEPTREASSSPYMYHFVDVKIIDSATSALLVPLEPTGHRLVSFVRLGGKLHLEGHTIDADKGACLLLAPGSKAEIELGGEELLPGAAYVIRFDAYRPGEREPAVDAGPCLPYETKIDATPLSRLVDLLGQMADRSSVGLNHEYIERFRRQICFQELLALLMDNVQAARSLSDATLAVQQTVAYLNQNFRAPITVEQLAKMSGIGRWKYSALFQSLTGKKPLDYLTEVRINRAKELLLSTDDPLREISRRVGFKDEYYFARRFRHAMGLTPKQYARSRSYEPPSKDQSDSPFKRVVAVGYALGDLIALGIKPVGADMTVIGKRVAFRDELQDIADIGLLGEPGKVRELHPDLIIYSSFRHDWIEKLSNIAPTVSIDRYEPTYDRFPKLAELFGKQDQARHWVESHKRNCEDMWKRLAINREKAAVFVFSDGSLYVMGMKGIALTLFHPLAFEPSDKVKEMIGSMIPFRAVGLEQIGEYEADRLFLLVDDNARSRSEAKRVTSSPYWSSFGPYRTHVMEAKWNFDDPITMDWLLPVLPRIIRSQ